MELDVEAAAEREDASEGAMTVNSGRTGGAGWNEGRNRRPWSDGIEPGAFGQRPCFVTILKAGTPAENPPIGSAWNVAGSDLALGDPKG